MWSYKSIYYMSCSYFIQNITAYEVPGCTMPSIPYHLLYKSVSMKQSLPVFQPQKILQHIAGIMITAMNHNYKTITTIANSISKSHLHLEGFLSFPLCDPISLPHFQGHLPGVAFSEVATQHQAQWLGPCRNETWRCKIENWGLHENLIILIWYII